MAVLVRKVTRAKWERREGLADGEIPSDAVSSDLKTTDNTLSFWMCNASTVEEIRRAVLALAAADTRCDRMDVAWLEDATIGEQGLRIEHTEGRTPVASLRHRHVDLVRLDAYRLVKVASLVANALERGQHRRLTKREVVAVVVQAVRERMVALDELADDVRIEVQRGLEA